MTPTKFVHLLRRRWATAVAVLVVCLIGAIAYAMSTASTYSATTTLYVSMATGTSVNDAYQGGMAAQQRVTSYSYLAGGPAVAERVIDDLGLDTTPEDLQAQVSVTFPPATTLLEITAADPTPDGAVLLADAFAAQFRTLVTRLETTVAGAAPAAQATVIEPAELPVSPIGRSLTETVVLGGVVGLVLGMLAAFARDRLDRRVRRPEQLGALLAAPLVAVGADESSALAYARLRRALLARSGLANPVTLMVTSVCERSLPWVGLRLARSLAAAGTKTVVVDTDASTDGPSSVLGLQAQPGVADWLASPSVVLDDVLRHTDHGHAIVPSGVVGISAVDLLDSERFSFLLTELGDRFDTIVIVIASSPSPGDVAGMGVSWRCAGVVVAGELGRCTLKDAREAAVAFAEAELPVLAAVALTSARTSGRFLGRRPPADAVTRELITEPVMPVMTPEPLTPTPTPTPQQTIAPEPQRPTADLIASRTQLLSSLATGARRLPSPRPRTELAAGPPRPAPDDALK